MHKICITLVMAALFILMCGCNASKKNELPIPPVDLLGNTERIVHGQQLFAAHCAECHGSIAEGRTQRAARLTPFPPDFYEIRYRKALPGYLYRRIEQGRKMEPFRSRGSVMPPWRRHLDQEQIWSLVAFIRNRAGVNVLK